MTLGDKTGNNLPKIKKRLGLFSPRRLGSPPPELPNHSWILGLAFFFVNVTLVIGFGPYAESSETVRWAERIVRPYCSFCQVCPASAVVQTSAVEVAIFPCCVSVNWMLMMSPVSAATAEAGSTRVQRLPPSEV